MKVFGDAIRFVVQLVCSLHRPPFIKGVVNLKNGTFQEISTELCTVCHFTKECKRTDICEEMQVSEQFSVC